jgi:uncharacterized delta-60 repeat protein
MKSRVGSRKSRICVLVILLLAGGACGGGGSKASLGPPQLVTATSGEPNQVTIDWTPAPRATSYNIYWSTTPGVTKTSGSKIPGATAPHIHTGLTEGTRYYYVVTSATAERESAESMEVWGTPSGHGTLDPDFGPGGWIVHDGAAGGGTTDYGYAVAVDSLGRIVVAGSSNNAAFNPDMVIWQLNDDGTLDLTFNAQGWLCHHNAAGGDGIDNGFDLVLEPSGRILVTGTSHNGSDYDMVVWAVTSTGAFDPTFGPGGWMVHHGAAGGSSHDQALGITLDGSGRILVTGSSTSGTGDQDMVVWRLTAGGMLDPNFGGQGWVLYDHGGAGGNDGGFDITVDSTGRILVGGQTLPPAGNYDMIAWRLNSDGTPDLTFAGQGWVIHDSAAGGGGTDWGRCIAEDGAGGVLLGGYSMNPSGDHDVALMRYTSTGSLDASFAVGGIALHGGAAGGSSEDRCHDMTVDASGRILLTGYSVNASGDEDMVVWRYDPGGNLDTAFNQQGWVTHDNAAGGYDNDQGRGITLDGSGRIVVAGYSRNQTPSIDYDMVVWRYR